MPTSPPLTGRLMRAINAAATAHRDQVRKGSGIPYVSHTYSVMYLVSRETGDEDILIAAVLHDVLEDVPHNLSEARMRAEFGDRVADIVVDLTKDPSRIDWQERADAYLDHLEHAAGDEAVLIACADKLHNLLSILDDHAELGDNLWTRFSSGRDQQLWWYRAVSELVGRRLPGLSLNRELVAAIERMAHLT